MANRCSSRIGLRDRRHRLGLCPADAGARLLRAARLHRAARQARCARRAFRQPHRRDLRPARHHQCRLLDSASKAIPSSASRAENTFIYIRGYPSKAERDKRLAARAEDPEFAEVVRKAESQPGDQADRQGAQHRHGPARALHRDHAHEVGRRLVARVERQRNPGSASMHGKACPRISRPFNPGYALSRQLRSQLRGGVDDPGAVARERRDAGEAAAAGESWAGRPTHHADDGEAAAARVEHRGAGIAGAGAEAGGSRL